jgi:4,5-dihydroxyphthalate decarboxylase
MNEVPISLAVGYYDHVADLLGGRVRAKGVALTPLQYVNPSEMFFRFILYRDFDVSEISLGKYAAMRSQGDESLVAIPVFPSRVFRHSAIYIRRDGRVREARDLNGCRVGLPEWAQTAAIYMRGTLQHEYGVDLSSITWIQAGVDEPGRIEKVSLALPSGITVTPAPHASLSEMLVAGEIDAAICAHVPAPFVAGHPNITRLFDDYVATEQRYYSETGIFPIMHTVAIRAELLRAYPWLAMNLYTAFDEARRLSVDRALQVQSHFPIPWSSDQARRARAMMGDDIWPYGIAENRTTLDAFLDYAFEQGVCRRRLTPDELFAESVQRRFRV